MLVLGVDVGPGQSGPLGLLVVALLGLAAFLLFRSLRKQLRRVPPRFDQHEREPDVTKRPRDP